MIRNFTPNDLNMVPEFLCSIDTKGLNGNMIGDIAILMGGDVAVSLSPQ